MTPDTPDVDTVFDRALGAALDAFKKALDDHFERTFDCSAEDELRVLAEYRASSEHLRAGARLSLRTGLVDADFTCWHSAYADENFGDT